MLLHNTTLRLFQGKLKSRWSAPFKLLKIYPHKPVDILDEQIGQEFKVNGHRIKHYIHPAAIVQRRSYFLKNQAIEQ